MNVILLKVDRKSAKFDKYFSDFFEDIPGLIKWLFTLSSKTWNSVTTTQSMEKRSPLLLEDPRDKDKLWIGNHLLFLLMPKDTQSIFSPRISSSSKNAIARRMMSVSLDKIQAEVMQYFSVECFKCTDSLVSASSWEHEIIIYYVLVLT